MQRTRSAVTRGRSDLSSLQDVVEAADAEPAIAVGFQDELMLAGIGGGAVVTGEQVDEAFGIFGADGERDFAGDGGEIVDHDDGVVAPVVAKRQDFGRLRL